MAKHKTRGGFETKVQEPGDTAQYWISKGRQFNFFPLVLMNGPGSKQSILTHLNDGADASY